MSIIKTRELLEKRGCGTCIGIVIGIVFLLGIAFSGQGAGCAQCDKALRGEQAQKYVVGNVADTDIDAVMFDGLVKRQLGGDESSISSLPVSSQVSLYGEVLTDMIRRARIVAEGKKSGIELTDDDLKKRIDADIDSILKTQYTGYVKQQPAGKQMTFEAFKATPGAIQYSESFRLMIAPVEKGEGAYYTKATYVEQDMLKKMTGGKDMSKLTTNERSKLMADLAAKTAKYEIDYPITWKDLGFKLLYQSQSAAKTYKALKPLIDEADALVKDTTKIKDSGMIKKIKYKLIEDAWLVATPAEQKDLESARTESIEDVLVSSEDFNLRMQLVDLYKKANVADKAVEHLIAASGNNVKYNDLGKANYDQVEKKLKELVDAKFIDGKAAQMVKDTQAKWVQGKAEEDKYKEEAKKMEAEREKEREADKKKFEEEKKKFQEEQAKKKAGSTGAKSSDKK